MRPLRGIQPGWFCESADSRWPEKGNFFHKHDSEKACCLCVCECGIPADLSGHVACHTCGDEWCDPHVQAHMAVQAPLLVERFGTVDAGGQGFVPEPPLQILPALGDTPHSHLLPSLLTLLLPVPGEDNRQVKLCKYIQ